MNSQILDRSWDSEVFRYEESRLRCTANLAQSLIFHAAGGPVFSDVEFRDASAQAQLRSHMEDCSAFQDLSEQVALTLSTSAAVIIENLEFDPEHRLLMGIATRLGLVFERNSQAWANLIRPISPATDRADATGVLNEQLHTDSTDWPEPNDYTVLLCVRPDSSGEGVSKILSGADLANELRSIKGEGFETSLRTTPLPWQTSETTATWSPILTEDIRWMKLTIEAAAASGTAELDTCQRELIDEFMQVVSNASTVESFMLTPSSMLIMKNKKLLHGRGPATKTSNRLLYRLKVQKRTAAD